MAKRDEILDSIKDLDIQKIAVLRALHLGDLLAVVPALKALRNSFPDAEITLIGLPWAKRFAHRYNQFIDKFIAFPGFIGLPETEFQPDAFTSFLSTVQKEEFDLAIQMQGSGSVTNGMMDLFEAKKLAGFYEKGNYKPNDSFFVEYKNEGHETERFLKLMEGLGLEAAEAKTHFPVFEAEEAAAARLLNKFNLPENEYVCLHAGSREEARRWDLDNFAKTAEYIHSKGYKIAFTGSEQERYYVEKAIQKTNAPAINLSGRTRLGEVAVVLKKSALLISNDTGVVHIASAIGAKSVVIYTKEGSNIERWAPSNREKHAIITPEKTKRVVNVLRETNAQLREKKQRAHRIYEHARAI